MHSQILILVILITFDIRVSQSMEQRNPLSIELIHRYSPKSPFYNQSISQSELLTQDVRRSHARVKILNSDSNYANIKEVVFALEGNGITYLTTYSLGSKEFKVLAFVSMTTSFIWTKCRSPYQQDDVVFEEEDSSDSYEVLRESDANCKLFPFRKSNDYGECAYSHDVNVENKNVHSSGVVGRDKFSFLLGDMEPKDILFGCSKINAGLDSKVQGVVGFGLGTISLPFQLGGGVKRKFTYCLRPAANKGTSTLRFGDIDKTTEKKMDSCLLHLPYSMTSSYLLDLKGVTVAGSEMIKTIGWAHPIAIDFGTPMTYLQNDIYLQVIKKVSHIMGAVSQITSAGFNLCFDF